MKNNFWLIFLLSGLLASCDIQYVNPSIGSGAKKRELQKVLDYYSDPKDSLKLQAAEYLLEHMVHHYYYRAKHEDEIDDFFQTINSQFPIDSIKDSYLHWFLRDDLLDNAVSNGLSDGSLTKPKYRKRRDIGTINADFIIENIEYAFKAWDFPWSRSYSFHDFCRYILPYRYGHEVPEPWRKTIYEQYKWVIDSVDNPNDPLEIATFVDKKFKYGLSICKVAADNGFRLKISNQLDAMMYTDCTEQAGLGVVILRALGIAATPVSIPTWGYRAAWHEYTGMLDAQNRWHYFNFGEGGPIEYKLGYQPPKMFFKLFDTMDRFKPDLQDASGEMLDAFDLEIEVHANSGDDIYLCVFGNLKWRTLCKGKNLGPKAIFENVAKDNYMYLAAVRSRGRLKAVSDIFTTDSMGTITYHKSHPSKTFNATFKRKYPKWGKDVGRLRAIVGGEFSASQSMDFANKKRLYKVDTLLKYGNNTMECPKYKAKYFRYDFPSSQDSIFYGPAEISFYTTERGVLKKIEGEYYGSLSFRKSTFNG